MEIKNCITSLKKQVALIIIIAIMINILSPGTVVNAHEKSPLNIQETQNIEQMLVLDESMIELSDMKSANIQSVFSMDLEQGNFTIQVAHENLDIDNLAAHELKDDDNEFISVVIPIIGEGYNQLSNLTIIYDLNLNVLSYQETTLTESINGTFQFTSYIDGQRVRNEITELEFVSNEVFEESLEALRTAFNNPNSRNAACLATVLGIGTFAATALYIMCAGSCASVVLVKVCVACIAGTVALAGTSTAAVVGCFGL
ncbi:hypothetical protein A5886_001213 [Enterococcus sp. 8G7_MSG3316]|uniref:Uncharacterized protein n=1 Tax=Candidatus Enterococcus testudinis TaxID=1834191 RepID=A0A242A523_9ENTE|nr:hypothetical protein [Enterococcus sp. 8G7_MSG3316]OTN76136.1 hypothetical protein A5886_001213 [Enterococcus sp. 8G7_MSG3316]